MRSPGYSPTQCSLTVYPRASSGDEQIRGLLVFANGYGLKQCSATAIAAYGVARQEALAVSGKMHGNIDMATWAESAAAWRVLNVTERLIPTGYLLNATG